MKKYISFILILSFVFPLFCFFNPLVTFADDSVSSDSAYISWTKDNAENVRNQLAERGYVIYPSFYDDYITSDSLWGVALNFWGVDITETHGKPLNRVAYEYCVDNDIDFIDCFDSVYNYAENECPYSIYTVFHKSDLVNLFNPSDSNTAEWLSSFNPNNLDSNYFYYFLPNTENYRLDNDNWGNHHLQIYRFPLDFVDTYSFYALGDTPSSLFDIPNFFSYVSNPDNTPTFNFYCASANGIPNTISCGFSRFYANGGFQSFEDTVSFGSRSGFGPLPLYYFNSDSMYRLRSGFFLVPDSVDKFSFSLFHSYNDYYRFINGQSKVYQFSSDFDDLEGVDLSKLYDVISRGLSDSSGNIIHNINQIANEYLDKQVELLGDIKNALNDETGMSWLRKIYLVLNEDYKSDFIWLKSYLENFHPSGGSADLTETNEILTDIYDRLGLMLGPVSSNGIDSPTISSMTASLSTRMPFSALTDIVVLITLFSRDPVRPDFQIPIPFNPGETFTIDLSSFEYARPFINGFFILIFIIGLLALTTKIFDSLKG